MGSSLGRLFFFVLMVFETTRAFPAGLERFVGVLRHESLQQEQLAKLDMILTRNAENRLELSGVLTLHFGDFDSGEYVAYHFSKIQHFIFDQTFTFDQADQAVTIRKAKLEGDRLVGEFRSEFSGNVGKLILSRTEPVAPTLPLIEPLWGEYSGKCDPYNAGGFKTNVQLYTHRSTADTQRLGNPFGAYSVKGFLGQDRGSTCISNVGSRMCVWSRFYGASYNFFKQRLLLYGRNFNLKCDVTATGLSCDGCTLTRISKETQEPRVLKPAARKAFFETDVKPEAPALSGGPSEIEGEYRGFVYHEQRDAYQPVNINILTYPVPEGTGQALKMSATATIYFGEYDSDESIVYRFEPRSFPNPLIMGQFVFERSENDVDAILRVDQIGRGIISGNWYSHLFGKVGRFFVEKANTLQLPGQARLIPSLSGHYESKQWNMRVSVGLDATPFSTENPFFPLNFAGQVQLTGIGAAREIMLGSYDFYTGRFYIQTENSGFVGRSDLDGRLHLKQTNLNILTTLPPHALDAYKNFGRD